MNRLVFWLALAVWFGLLAGVTGQVQQEQTIFQKCDRIHKDGHLDDEEFYVYSLHTGKAAAYWEAVDPKYEGKIDSVARDKMEKVSQDAAHQQVDYDRASQRGTADRDAIRV